jgi:hypothetical protein
MRKGSNPENAPPAAGAENPDSGGRPADDRHELAMRAILRGERLDRVAELIGCRVVQGAGRKGGAA